MMHLSIVNIDPENSFNLSVKPGLATIGKVTGRILTADQMNSHNTFVETENVVPEEFTRAREKDGVISCKIPAMSVIVLEVPVKN